MKNILITLLALLNFVICSATDYYVSSAGNDSNNGTSSSTPWKTISKVNSSSFKPGDRIMFRKGDTWRETLNMTSSGSSGSNIVYTYYGDGNAPKILGSSEITTWTNESGNIWYSTNNVSDPYSLSYKAAVYFKETNGNISWGKVKKSSKGELTGDYHWTWSSNHIYIYSSGNPNQKYAGMEATQRASCVNLNDKSYLTIDGLEIAYAGSTGVNELYSNTNTTDLIIRNCHIHHIGIKASSGAYGVSVWHSNMLIQNNVIHDCGRRNVSLNIYDRLLTVHDIIVEGNTLYHGFHTTGVDMAITGSGTIRNVTLRRNLIYDDVTETLDGVESYTSTMVYVANTSNGSISNLYIYNNVLKNVTNSGLAITGVIQAYIYNNTVYGVNPKLTSGNGVILNLQKCTFKNNIIYINTSSSGYRGFQVAGGDVISDNNLFYSVDPKVILVQRGTGYTTSNWSSYKSSTGQDAHSPAPADPKFISSTDFNLQSGSPAIDKGVDVGFYPFSGAAPDLGAYEFGSGSGVNQVPVISLTNPVNGSTFVANTAITISASASDPDGTVSLVEFYNGTTLLGSKSVPPYSFTWNNAAAGTYSLNAVVTDNLNAKVKSASVSITVTSATVTNKPPVISITSPSAGTDFKTGTPIIINATATDSDGSVSKVEFYNGSVLLGSKTTAPYTYTWSNAAVGTYSLNAIVTDNLNAKVKSSNVSITVSAPANKPPVISITSPASGTDFKVNTPIVISAAASDPDGTVSRVEFYNGTVLLGSKTTAPYTYTWNNAAVGTYSLNAVVTDNLNLKVKSSSTTIKVSNVAANKSPVISILTPLTGSNFEENTQVVINASSSDPDGTISKVEFYNGTVLLGSKTTAPYTYTWSNPAIGTYSLTAVVTDNLNAKTTSSAVTFTITSKGTTQNQFPAIDISEPTTGTNFNISTPIIINAVASDPDGSVNTVEFYNDEELLGSISSPPYSFTWTNVSVGTYSLSAVVTDNLNAKVRSSAITVSVTSEPEANISPVVNIVNPNKGSSYTENSTFSIDAVASDPDGTIVSVEFYNGSDLLAELTSAPYSYILKDATSGNYSITAHATDNSGSVTISLPVEFQISSVVSEIKPTNVTLFPNPNKGLFSIELTDPLQNEESVITITNLYGRIVFNETLRAGELLKNIDLPHIKTGVYVLMVLCKNVILSKKFIIY